jgi:hypothetical protein
MVKIPVSFCTTTLLRIRCVTQFMQKRELGCRRQSRYFSLIKQRTKARPQKVTYFKMNLPSIPTNLTGITRYNINMFLRVVPRRDAHKAGVVAGDRTALARSFVRPAWSSCPSQRFLIMRVKAFARIFPKYLQW